MNTKSLAVRAGIILAMASGNGNSSNVVDFDFDVKTLFSQIEDAILLASGDRKSFFEVIMPPHPGGDPRDHNRIIEPYHHNLDDLQNLKTRDVGKNVAEQIELWRHFLEVFGSSEGLEVHITPNKVCHNCEGIPPKRRACKVCGGKIPRLPMLSQPKVDDNKFAKWHTLSFHWRPIKIKVQDK